MSNDYVEQLLSSVKIVAEAEVKKQKHDITVIGTIVDNSNRKNGIYTVKNDDTEFTAYSENLSYKKDDQVRVQVMDGDWSSKKFIQGKYISDENKPMVYVSAASAIVDMTNNLIQNQSQKSLTANDPSKKEICVASINLEDNSYDAVSDISFYDTIHLSAYFKCLLSNRQVKQGHYGLKIKMVIANGENTVNTWTKNFDSSDMFGDPYAFSFPSRQEINFNVNIIGTIKAISIYLYQNNDFHYFTDDGKEKILEKSPFNNIFVQDIYLSFGKDLSKIEDNTVEINTKDSTTYSKLEEPKRIGLIWYNKDENNKYIGFSDGQTDLVDFEGTGKFYLYDEIKYQKYFQKVLRLEAQKEKAPQDFNGLSTSAQCEDICLTANKLLRLTDNELERYIRRFKNELIQIQPVQEPFQNILDSIASILSQKEKISQFQKTANEILNYAHQYYLVEHLGQTDIELPLDKAFSHVSCSWIGSTQDIGTWAYDIQNIKTKLSTISNIINSSEYSNYSNINNSYQKKILAILSDENNEKSIEGLLKRHQLAFSFEGIPKEQIQVIDQLNRYIDKKWQFRDAYEINDFSKYDNYYSIYWFKKTDPNEIDDILGPGWARMSEYDNKILPPIKENAYEKKGSAKNSSILFIPKDEKQEIIKAVIFFNHVAYESNNILFENESYYLDEQAVDAAQALKIKHKEKSQSSYALYDLNNQIIRTGEKVFKRTIELSFEGVSKGNEALKNSSIYWYLPIQNTMLDYNEDWYSDFIVETDINPTKFHLDGYKYFSITPTDPENKNLEREFYYKIKPYYSITANNNTIKCLVIDENGVSYKAEINFTFSKVASDNVDNKLIITPNSLQQAVSPNKPLILDINLYDNNNNEIILRKSDTLDPKNKNDANDTKVNWHQAINLASEIISLPETGEDIITGCKISALGTNADIIKYGVIQVKTAADRKYFSSTETKKIKYQTLTSYYPLAFCADKEDDSSYYMEGASTIVYDSFGTSPKYYKGSYKLFSTTGEEVEDVAWEIVNLIKITNLENEEEEKVYLIDEAYNLYDSYDKLIQSRNVDDKSPFLASTQLAEDEKKYYKLSNQYAPKIDPNKQVLIPAPIYIEGDNKYNYYSVAVCYSTEEGKRNSVYWAQSLFATESKSDLATLNNWDGKLQVDEEKNSILTAMLAAGRKSLENNFEGILLGDIGVEADYNTFNKTGVGLYGYQNGIQTFGVNIDGTSFLGNKAMGRIEFNGQNGIIKSGNWDGTIDNDKGTIVNMGTGGMAISLKTGTIAAYNFSLKSNSISLNSNPASDDYYFCVKNNNGEEISYNQSGTFIIKVKDLIIGSDGNAESLIDKIQSSKHSDREILEIVAKAGDGLTLQGDKLYISASGISTGILKSQNNEFLLDLNKGEITVQDGLTIQSKSKNFILTKEGHLTSRSAQIAGWKMIDVEPVAGTHPDGVGGVDKWENGQCWHGLIFDNEIDRGDGNPQDRRMIMDPSRDIVFAINVAKDSWFNTSSPDFNKSAFGVRYDGSIVFNYYENNTLKYGTCHLEIKDNKVILVKGSVSSTKKEI